MKWENRKTDKLREVSLVSLEFHCKFTSQICNMENFNSILLLFTTVGLFFNVFQSICTLFLIVTPQFDHLQDLNFIGRAWVKSVLVIKLTIWYNNINFMPIQNGIFYFVSITNAIICSLFCLAQTFFILNSHSHITIAIAGAIPLAFQEV